MIKLKTLLHESTDNVIEKFISLLPKYDLEFHSWDNGPEKAFQWRGGTYPTVMDKEGKVKVALDRTDIFNHDGRVWMGDPSRPMLNGYVIQAIVTDPQHRGKGLASEILKRMIQAADEAGLLLKLEPVPMKDFIKKKEKGLTHVQLKKWYAKHGFEKEPDVNIMTRKPLTEGLEYPLAKKGDLHSYEGQEGWKGKIVWMAPDKFLKLCHPIPDWDDRPESSANIEHRIKIIYLWIFWYCP